MQIKHFQTKQQFILNAAFLTFLLKKEGNLFSTSSSGKSRIAFGLSAICLGWIGTHYFYIGKIGAGIQNLLCYTLGCLFIFLFILPLIICILCSIQGITAFTLPQK